MNLVLKTHLLSIYYVRPHQQKNTKPLLKRQISSIVAQSRVGTFTICNYVYVRNDVLSFCVTNRLDAEPDLRIKLFFHL